MQGLMVPVMMATLFVVVASRAGAVAENVSRLIVLVPLYGAFLVVMAVLGMIAGKIARLDAPSRRALVFSGATRNSLVVRPLALALPPDLGLAPFVVVTQTLVELVELVGMIIYVHAVPALIPSAVEPTQH